MRLRVLGCSGGIGAGLRTTSLLVDDDVLIDCGSGVGDLSIDELHSIRHIFLTHAHMDHTAFLPLLVDTVFDALLHKPLTLYLQVETLNMLRAHIFNWEIWPDFFSLPDSGRPVLQFQLMPPGGVVELDGRVFESIDVSHSQPAVGFRVASPDGRAFAFGGDTGATEHFWTVLNAYPGLDLLIMECAYADHDRHLSQMAGHHRSSTLAKDLLQLVHRPALYITHLKPGDEKLIMGELKALVATLEPQRLQRGQLFKL